ncbi:Sulfate transport system protein cysZ [Labilithrix luteola]|uniref:Sulfate transport system protein cysZ n=1 Tax=Labilithrix luteola TaxID=1391654 RepID=A0A0K1QEB1_9BACT|nr:EI24 domain-containing protein [Labilithrix luteola]AKV04099.1 Sulfate transport system protein cysZ [Labilithrix luteola]
MQGGSGSQAFATKAGKAGLGFFAGVRAVFGGVGFVVSTPSVWGWALVPVVIAAALFGGVGAGAVWAGTELSSRMMTGEQGSAWLSFGLWALWALRIVFWIVGLVVAFVIAMSLAQPLSGFALETIAKKQELALGGRGRGWPDQPFVSGFVRSLRVTLTALAVGLPILAVLAAITLLFPPASVVTIPLKFVVTGVLAAYDLLDYPFSIRGRGVRDRLGFIRDNFAAVLGFGVTMAALLLVPGMGLFLLPFGVAGASRLVFERDARR